MGWYLQNSCILRQSGREKKFDKVGREGGAGYLARLAGTEEMMMMKKFDKVEGRRSSTKWGGREGPAGYLARLAGTEEEMMMMMMMMLQQ